MQIKKKYRREENLTNFYLKPFSIFLKNNKKTLSLLIYVGFYLICVFSHSNGENVRYGEEQRVKERKIEEDIR